MKKILSLVIVIAVILSVPVYCNADDSIKVYINNLPINCYDVNGKIAVDINQLCTDAWNSTYTKKPYGFYMTDYKGVVRIVDCGLNSPMEDLPEINYSSVVQCDELSLTISGKA